MDWVELTIRVDAVVAEAVAEALADFSYQGVTIERDDIPVDRWDESNLPAPTQQIVRAYFLEDGYVDVLRAQVEAALDRFNVTDVQQAFVKDEDWAHAWKQYYHPIRIGKNIIVRPRWEEASLKPDDIEIALDPGMAFGTGTHATTQLCLEAIENRLGPNMRVLDLGCGSGILSIAAAKLGARSVFAIDIDPVATEAAAENIEQNGVTSHVKLATGGLDAVLATGESYQFVVVNILARIILEMCDNGLGDVVKPGGVAIFSGIIQSQVEDVQSALLKNGLKTTSVHTHGDWVLLETLKTQ